MEGKLRGPIRFQLRDCPARVKRVYLRPTYVIADGLAQLTEYKRFWNWSFHILPMHWSSARPDVVWSWHGLGAICIVLHQESEHG